MNGSEEYLFVYGTLLEADVRQWVFGRSVSGQPDELPGHSRRIATVAGRYDEVLPAANPGETVTGQCLVIGPGDLQRADAYETSLYYRRKVQLASGRMAWVYMATQPANEVL